MSRPLRVLFSVPPPSAASNPYTTMLVQRVSRTMSVDYFSWRRALVGNHDVLHVHWPEAMVRHPNRHKALLRAIAGHVYLLRAKLTRKTIVRTVHNREPHENGSVLERAFMRRLDRAVDHYVHLSDVAESDVQSTMIPHGHYREWAPYTVDLKGISPRLLLFGALRRYKGIEEAIRAFHDVPRASRFTLTIAGAAVDKAYASEVISCASGDERIDIHDRRLPDGELAQLVAGSAAVILPYRDFYNSGAAILALSLGTPIVVPRTAATESLLDEFGEEWVTVYDGALTAGDLIAAAERGLCRGARQPEMGARDWDVAEAAHTSIYRRLVELKRAR